ncbi:hypothetical protein AN9475.2 [Aspergillus nidulans FGSC A4]|uniref:Uncharacterized protein n=1 Tax=Emericella nidulans (strain FGSC A4 / ATCC 38163 / CBS 112.46 / NRRL 194 / M139) TaxID=227321 RepID=Q5AQF5_EMENI|nr:hypothetical protein [Aspergillus nidulans FGSC A4]EAA66785.1 hypothetical protein AN9475.2 [Aspergillus nidulans FGSC A4]CBF80692.1 TPA: conserved hypothetical protein [Aspergillus nidulans FGSC A4]|eukprot:XP_868857.1 hypothetical protein AN9475.2 [Aspergillus nidulans FGSC A4]
MRNPSLTLGQDFNSVVYISNINPTLKFLQPTYMSTGKACGVAWQVWLIVNQRRIMISYVTYLQDSIIFLSLIEAVQNSAKLDKQDII